MKKIGILLISLFLLASCTNKAFQTGYSSNMKNESDLKKLKELLNNNNLDNVDTIIERMKDFNKYDDNGCGIKDWFDSESFNYNESSCAERWEQKNSISDGNCRLTAFTLLMNHFTYDKLINKEGSYLMFDMDVLENNSDYKLTDEKTKEFITLFNEINVGKEKLENVYPNKWQEYGIKIKDGKASLISVVIHDSYSNIMFVGHTGVLIDLDGKYLFIEKIAFEQPYQINVLSKKEDLKELFSKRSTYFGDENGPFVYENNKLLFKY